MESVLSFLRRNLLGSLAGAFLVGCVVTYISVGYKKCGESNIQIESGAEDTDASEIVIDISGAVSNPGLYKVGSDLRVGEAIEKAGGFADSASVLWITKNLNLSQKLVDTQKVYIPFEWETVELKSYEISTLTYTEPAGDSTATSDSGGKTNVNTASVEDLDELPGIGPVYAQKIVDNRTYSDLTDFKNNSGLSESTIEKVEDLISF